MKYYNSHYFVDTSEHFEHRAKYGTANSVTDEKGTDSKKNNSSKYNHEYYMRNKSKWQDNDSDSSSSGSKESDEDKEFDVDAAARDVIRGMYGNGAERKEALGDDYAAVQKRVNELMKQMGAGKGEKDSNKSDDSDSKKSGNSDDKNAWERAKSEYYKKQKKK